MRRNAEAPDRVIGSLVNAFTQFTFDEFHIFESPQIVAVTNILLLIRELAGARCPRFLFLSATPNEAMLQFLNRAGVPFQEIKGQYAHGTSPNIHDWRLILRETQLTLRAMTITEWVDAHLDDTLLRFFHEQGKHAKGAIIVNSVATAQGLYRRLKSSCDRYGIRLALNTGFDSKKARQQSYDADLLIGTSTIDVGVDFKINFLLFESRDAGTFLQRLGRLGRHGEFERNGENLEFHKFEAHALVPEWVHTALFEGRDGQPRMLAADESVDREMFANFIKTAFPTANPFVNYGRHWGGLQSAHICMFLANPLIRDAYTETRKRLIGQYERVLDIHINSECRRLTELRKEQPPLVDEALSFRGSSLFECGVIDMRLPEGEIRAKRYNLLWLLSNTHIELIDKDAFEKIARLEGWVDTTLKRFNPVAYCKCLSLRDEHLNIEFLVGHDLQAYEADWFHTAQVLDQIEITTKDVPSVNTINRILMQLELPVLLSTFSPHELRRRMRLPSLFQLYAMRGRGDTVKGTIAFGRQALMLDSLLRGRRDLLPPQTAIIS